jgi:hypothetical protein
VRISRDSDVVNEEDVEEEEGEKRKGDTKKGAALFSWFGEAEE